MTSIFLFSLLYLVGMANSKVHLALVVCNEDLSVLENLDCDGYDRILLYEKCSSQRTKTFPECVKVTRPPLQKYSKTAKAEETFLYDMINFRENNFQSELLVYMKASTFLVKHKNFTEFKYILENLPNVASKVDFMAISYGRSEHEELCKHPILKVLRRADYRGSCKGNVILRASFAVSSESFKQVPFSVLEKLYALIRNPQKLDMQGSNQEKVRHMSHFLEKFWQILFECVPSQTSTRYCRKITEGTSYPLHSSPRRGGAIIIGEVLHKS